MATEEFIEGGGRLVGYARVSSVEQDTALQLTALHRAGVAVIFEEKVSAVAHRPALEEMLDSLRPGDTLCVYKIDRLARSLSHLLRILERIEAAGALFRSLTQPVETVTPMGRLMLQLLGSFAEFERAMIRERCAAGRVEARARGVYGGRPRKIDYLQALDLHEQGLTNAEIAALLGVYPGTVCKALGRVRRIGRDFALPQKFARRPAAVVGVAS